MNALDAARELIDATDDHESLVVLHRKVVDRICKLKGTPDSGPALYRTQTRIAKRLSLARTRLEAAREHGRGIAVALFACSEVARGLADRVAAQSELLSRRSEK